MTLSSADQTLFYTAYEIGTYLRQAELTAPPDPQTAQTHGGLFLIEENGLPVALDTPCGRWYISDCRSLPTVESIRDIFGLCQTKHFGCWLITKFGDIAFLSAVRYKRNGERNSPDAVVRFWDTFVTRTKDSRL